MFLLARVLLFSGSSCAWASRVLIRSLHTQVAAPDLKAQDTCIDRARARTRATEVPSVQAGLHTCLFLLYPHLLPGSRRTLRLSCKAALHVMDSCVRRLELRLHKFDDSTVHPYTYEPSNILPPSRPNDQDRLLRACAIRWPAVERLALANLDLNAASLTFPPRLKTLTMTRTYLRSKGSNVIGPLASLASTLQVLDIDISDLVLRDCPVWHRGLATQLQQLTSLQCLRLTISQQCKDTVPYLDALAALTGLTQLALARSKFGDAGYEPDNVQALSQCLARLTRLQVLHLSTGLYAEGAEALAGALTCLSALQDLSLADCELVNPLGSDEDAFEVIEGGAQGGHPLQALYESKQALQVLQNGSRIAILEQALGSLTNLTRLDLSDNFLGRSVLLLPRALPHLHTLKLSRKLEYKPYDYYARFSAAPNMTVEAASCSAHVLRRYSNLTHLDVSGCYLGEPDLTPELPALWCNALAALPALRVLRIDECWMDGAEVLCHLAPALRQLTRLEQLDLGGNRVMDRESSELSPFWSALERLTALTRLDLHKTCLSQSCLTNLTQVLPQLHQLSYLDISNNGLDSQCAHPLAFCLPQLTSLRELRAGSCGYNVGVEAVLASLQGLTGLEVVEVWSRGRMMFAPVRLEALLPVLRGLSGLVRLHTLLLLPTSITPSDRDWAMQGKRGLTGKILRILPSLQEVWV